MAFRSKYPLDSFVKRMIPASLLLLAVAAAGAIVSENIHRQN